MASKIHKTAQIDSKAELYDNVVVAEFATIGPDVILEEGVQIGHHVTIGSNTKIGSGTKIFHCSAIGLPPQDLAYKNEPTELIIGKNNIIREFVSIHRGTTKETGQTIIGDGNHIMAYVHVAHDCHIGNEAIIANAVNLGGHVHIDDNAVIGGMSAIHQFVHIGSLAMVGASSLVLQDVLPYALVSGNPARVRDVNRIGMRRKRFPSKTIDAIHKTIITLTRKGLPLPVALEYILQEVEDFPEKAKILNFIENMSKRGILRGEVLGKSPR